MAVQQAGHSIELNFDGLTDAVTNLAGSLVLLVVLIFAISREQPLRPDQQPERFEHQGYGEKTVKALLARINDLKAQIKREEEQISRLESAIESLEEEIMPLSKASSSKPQKK